MSELTYDHVRQTGQDIRVHGNGFIQIDLSDNQRLNVWGHPRIPRQVVSSQVHDHTFDFTSTVLRGVMVHVEWSIWDHDVPLNSCPVYEVYHPITRQGEDTFLEKEPGLFKIVPNRPIVRQAGESYEFTAGRLHSTFVNEPTVTLIDRRRSVDYNQPARVLVPAGQQPDNTFNRYDVHAEALWAIVRETME